MITIITTKRGEYLTLDTIDEEMIIHKFDSLDGCSWSVFTADIVRLEYMHCSSYKEAVRLYPEIFYLKRKLMFKILQQFNENNSTKYKLEKLKEHSSDELFKRILKMTYDKVIYNYHIKKIPEYTTKSILSTLEDALNFLEYQLSDRVISGNKAIEMLSDMLSSLSPEDAYLIERVIDRDLKIGINKSSINKILPDHISKPVYQRCETYREDGIDKKTNKFKKGTSNKIKYSAILNLKADGSYREANVTETGVEFLSRSGEEYSYPLLAEELSELPCGRYFGELTVLLDDELLASVIGDIENDNPEVAEKILEDYSKGMKILPRALGNGLLNSDNVPHENIVMDLWEYVTEEEYQNAKRKIENKSKYIDRFLELEKNLFGRNRIRIIEYVFVDSKAEALTKVAEWMDKGLEGGVLKNLDMVFRDGTNTEQLKMKLKISAEMRCVGFKEGKKGTKREKTFGSMLFENDEGTIKGYTSGFSDKLLALIHENREEYIGKVIEVEFNDITKAQNKDYWALSHPRFIEVREKTETDTLEKVFELKEMAKAMK